MDWEALLRREVTPPVMPTLGASPDDTLNFDHEFTRMAARDTPSSFATPLKNSFDDFTYLDQSFLADESAKQGANGATAANTAGKDDDFDEEFFEGRPEDRYIHRNKPSQRAASPNGAQADETAAQRPQISSDVHRILYGV
jgi:hypothetical protein